jgi:hypothetical protein
MIAPSSIRSAPKTKPWMRVRRRAVVAIVALGALLAAATALGFGGFKSVKTLPNSGIDYGVAVGDVNGDGKADIVAANGEHGDDHVSYFRGRGDGTFRPEQSLPAGTNPDGVAIGSLNGDRRKDIAVANYADDTVSILLQKADGDFRDGGTLDAGPGAWQVAITDLNRDGRPDLVTGNYDSTGPDAVSVLLGQAGGGFEAHDDYAANGGSYGIAVGRMNADKRPDVLSIDPDGNPSVLLGKADGSLGGAHTRIIGGGGQAFDPDLGDFNRDGKLDVALADWEQSQVLVLLGKGDGTLRPQIAKPTATGPNAVEAGDFNRDGKLDLAVGLYDAPYGAQVLPGRGNGTFRAPKSYEGADVVEALASGRLNGDKGADLVAGTDSGLDIFLNKR